MKKLLLCGLVLCVVAGGAFATKEKEAAAPAEGTRGLLDCSSATPLACGGTLAGTNVGGPSNVTTYACVPFSETGPEAVYTFTIASRTNVTIDMVPSACDLDLVLLGSCDESDCLGYSGSTGAEQIVACLDAGTYFVVVDGYSLAACGFTLTLTCDACPEPPVDLNGAETCDGAPNLCDYVNGAGAFNIAWSMAGFVNDYSAVSGGCTGYASTGPDMVYTLCLQPGGTIDACMNPTTYFDAVLWLVTDCADAAGTCVAGDDSGNPECITYTSTTGGTYYLILDKYGSTTTSYGGLLYGSITGCCTTGTESTTWGNVKTLFR